MCVDGGFMFECVCVEVIMFMYGVIYAGFWEFVYVGVFLCMWGCLCV